MESIQVFSVTILYSTYFLLHFKIAKDAFSIVLYVTTFYRQHCTVESNLDYLDSLGPDEIVRIIEGLDNQKYEY